MEKPNNRRSPCSRRSRCRGAAGLAGAVALLGSPPWRVNTARSTRPIPPSRQPRPGGDRARPVPGARRRPLRRLPRRARPRAALEAGADVPLSGGIEFHLPVGVFPRPQHHPRRETGIGRYRDPRSPACSATACAPTGGGVAVHAVRQPRGRRSDRGHLVPAHAAGGKHAVAPHAPNALGHLALAFMLAPKGPSRPIVKSVPPAPTVDNGRYLANSVGNCVTCHSRVDMRTGAIMARRSAAAAVHEAVRQPGARPSSRPT